MEEFERLVQGDLPVQEYEISFTHLSRFAENPSKGLMQGKGISFTYKLIHFPLYSRCGTPGRHNANGPAISVPLISRLVRQKVCFLCRLVGDFEASDDDSMISAADT